MPDRELENGGGRDFDHLAVCAGAEIVEVGVFEIRMAAGGGGAVGGAVVEIVDRRIDDEGGETVVPTKQMGDLLGSVELKGKRRCVKNVLYRNRKLTNTASSLEGSSREREIRRYRILQIANIHSSPPQHWKSNSGSLSHPLLQSSKLARLDDNNREILS